jgi:hypothetical protein
MSRWARYGNHSPTTNNTLTIWLLDSLTRLHQGLRARDEQLKESDSVTTPRALGLPPRRGSIAPATCGWPAVATAMTTPMAP